MNKIAILFSGHLRNISEHIDNLKNNLLNPIENNNYSYDIYIHTWDKNITNDIIFNNDKHFKNNNIDEIINKINDNIKIKKIIIENQDGKNIEEYVKSIIYNKSIHGKFDSEYVYNLTSKLYYQYYGQFKSYEMINNIDEYDFIIKTRPDVYYYDKFDIDTLNKDLIFPNSHTANGTNINQIFYCGKTAIMKEILNFFEYVNNKDKFINMIEKYHPNDVNLNQIFRYYIIDYLHIDPFFSSYNPGIYRQSNMILKLS